MVSEKLDLPDRDDVRPTRTGKMQLLKELTELGEAEAYLSDGRVVELHDYDTHFFMDAGVVYRKTEEEDDEWIFAEEVVSVLIH